MAGKGQKYAKEFKDSAIQLALNSEKSVIKIAEELGVHEKTLYGWISRYKRDNNLESSVNKKINSKEKESLEEENRRLRKELANVKKDREILKKAAAYFAKESL
jgi:transposase